MDSPKKMNDYWHIPRASLAPSSAASTASSSNRSHRSHSNPPTVAQRSSSSSKQRKQLPLQEQQHYQLHQNQHHNQQQLHELVGEIVPYGGRQTTSSSSSSATSTRGAGHAKRVSSSHRASELSAATTAAAAAAVLAAASASASSKKRGSRSSQGSSESNNSTRSAASGSLLLTAANLERFAEIHKKQQHHNKLYLENMPAVHASNNKSNHGETTTNAIYNANLVHALNQQQNNKHNNDAIIAIDPNLDFIKTKDLDTVSIASSMHFTMVNGEGGAARKKKRGLCDRGRQVTVLIVCMSTIFMLLIMSMVYALEMRAREMPQS